MRYTVFIEPTHEPDQPGWYYAHIPALDLTTHGYGVEAAMQAAKDLVKGWIAELREQGQDIPVEELSFITQIEVPEDALHGA